MDLQSELKKYNITLSQPQKTGGLSLDDELRKYNITPAQSTGGSGISLQEELSKYGFGSGILTDQPYTSPQRKKKWIEKDGFLQSVFKPAINLGEDIYAFTKEGREIRAQLDASKLTEEEKQTITGFYDVAKKPSAQKLVGDVLGTAVLAVGPEALIKSAGTGLGTILLRGAVGGSAVGFAEGMSEEKNALGVIGDTAIGTAFGAATGGLLNLGGRGAKYVAQKGVKNIGKALEETYIGNMLTSVRTRIKRFGGEAEDLAYKIDQVDQKTSEKVGKFMDESQEAGLYKLSVEERWSGKNSLLDELEGRTKPTQSKTYKVVDDLRKDIATKAEDLKIKTRLSTGEEVAFKSRKNYFPHYVISPDDVVTKSRVYKDAIENAVRLNKFKTIEKAEKGAKAWAELIEKEGRGGKFFINWMAKNNKTSVKFTNKELKIIEKAEKGSKIGMPKELQIKYSEAQKEARGVIKRYIKGSRQKKQGVLEQARELDFPFYDPDPARVMPRFASGDYQRLANIEAFGQKGEVISKTIGKIQELKGADSATEFSRLVDIALDNIESLPKDVKFAELIRILSIPKLAFSQIINLGQSVTNTTLASDLPTVARGIRAAFSNKGIRTALKSGATIESTINEITRRTGESSFGTKFLRWTGFTATEKFNRIVSANIGYRWAEKNLKRLLKNPLNKSARANLAELGIDPIKATVRGKLTEQELLTAARMFSEKTQFRARAMDLPAFAASPWGKTMFQFKNFAYNQTKFLRREFEKELAIGNYGRAVRNVLILGTIFPMTGEVLGDIRSIVTGTRRPTKALDRYFDSLAQAGGLGLLSDLVQSASIGKLSSTILGPTVSSGVEVTETLTDAIKNGRVTNSQAKKLINLFGVTRPIGNYVFKSDYGERETFIETLQDLFNY